MRCPSGEKAGCTSWSHISRTSPGRACVRGTVCAYAIRTAGDLSTFLFCSDARARSRESWEAVICAQNRRQSVASDLCSCVCLCVHHLADRQLSGLSSRICMPILAWYDICICEESVYIQLHCLGHVFNLRLSYRKSAALSARVWCGGISLSWSAGARVTFTACDNAWSYRWILVWHTRVGCSSYQWNKCQVKLWRPKNCTKPTLQ